MSVISRRMPDIGPIVDVLQKMAVHANLGGLVKRGIYCLDSTECADLVTTSLKSLPYVEGVKYPLTARIVQSYDNALSCRWRYAKLFGRSLVGVGMEACSVVVCGALSLVTLGRVRAFWDQWNKSMVHLPLAIGVTVVAAVGTISPGRGINATIAGAALVSVGMLRLASGQVLSKVKAAYAAYGTELRQVVLGQLPDAEVYQIPVGKLFDYTDSQLPRLKSVSELPQFFRGAADAVKVAAE